MVPAADDGQLIAGRYRPGEQVGAGGTGVVRRAEDVVLGRRVTLREVRLPDGWPEAARAAGRQRCLREVRAVAELDHPGCLAVLDVVDDGAVTSLVQPDVPGARLSEVLAREGPLSPQRAALVGLAVLGVLEAAHERGLLHRDVTPGSVLLSAPSDGSPGRTLLTGFGVVHRAGDAVLTGAGLVVASPGYCAPEVARGEAPGPAADTWSLGATLSTAVEGRPPYQGDDARKTLAAVVRGGHVPSARAGDLQPVLARMLEPDPARRIGARELEQALGAVATSRAAGTAPAGQPLRAVVPDLVTRTAVLPVVAPGPLVAPPPPVPPAAPARRGAARVPLHTSHRAPVPYRRRALVLAGLAAAVLLAVVLVTVRGGADPSGSGVAEPPGTSAPATVGATLPPPPEGTPAEQLSATIPALAELVARDPAAVGPGAGGLVEDLRRIESLDGPGQRSAALAAAAAVDEASRAGDLAPAVARQVGQVLGDVARPDRLVDLVAALDLDPLAAGPDGAALFDGLWALDHQVPGDRTAAEAAALLETVTAAAAQGRLTDAAAQAVLPTLRELADPAPLEDLAGLLERTEADPDAVGPAADDVLEALRGMPALPVYDLGNRAAGLLELLGQEGQVEPAFRDAAVPVVVRLVR
jgi:eukaryotic-like serine/threonine-protein kinase